MKRKIKILLVDDDQVDRIAIERAVREQNLPFDLDMADSYKEGLEKSTKNDYDILILDHNLGDGYGVDILKKVDSTPVIFITGSGDEQIAAQAVRLGAYDYLVKDPDRNYINLLYTTVENVLKRKRVEQEVIEAREKAENATRLKDKFVSLVAHDLRSPLASNIGLLNYLRQELEIPNPAKRKLLLDQLIEINTRMFTLIDELLDITSLQTGRITPKPKFVDARGMAMQAISNLSYLAEEKGITLNVQIKEGSRIYADQILFAEVVQNLLSNAIKFCDEGDNVTIYIPDDQPTTIAVKDTGIGVEEVILKNIFKHEIKTTREGTRGEKGTGLGLPYCTDIMKAHEGSLSVKSKMGIGTVFHASLPFVMPSVLIVNDDEDTRKLIKSRLEKSDLLVLEAFNGVEAMAAIDKKIPDLIITDVAMPEMNGITLIEKLKSDTVTREIPIMVITRFSENDTRDKVLRLGVDDFISKKLIDEELTPRVRKLIG